MSLSREVSKEICDYIKGMFYDRRNNFFSFIKF